MVIFDLVFHVLCGQWAPAHWIRNPSGCAYFEAGTSKMTTTILNGQLNSCSVGRPQHAEILQLFTALCTALDDFASSQRMGDIVYNKNWDVREHPRTKRMKICDFFQETQSSVNVVDSCCLHTKPRENWNDNKTKVSIWSVSVLVLTHHYYAFVVAGPSHLLF